MRVAILQPSYLPWLGYFDLMNRVDTFVYLDDVQFTRRDWRNRNKIKTAQGSKWLTIPVNVKGKYLQKIKDVEIADPTWARNHWDLLRHSYGNAPFFTDYKSRFEELYLTSTSKFLSEVNLAFIVAINDVLGIQPRITRSSDYVLADGKTERLVAQPVKIKNKK